ncbi:DUF6415 family natural product biosynthesis protein [Streptomyces sp. NPDC059506]|uniref:DUF6415 family natural product biosynthesis protein n=1 Tax=Streptomyces sp. NPDC059506 TaxID=3347751 RepID=UPI00367BFC2C
MSSLMLPMTFDPALLASLITEVEQQEDDPRPDVLPRLVDELRTQIDRLLPYAELHRDQLLPLGEEWLACEAAIDQAKTAAEAAPGDGLLSLAGCSRTLARAAAELLRQLTGHCLSQTTSPDPREGLIRPVGTRFSATAPQRSARQRNVPLSPPSVFHA